MVHRKAARHRATGMAMLGTDAEVHFLTLPNTTAVNVFIALGRPRARKPSLRHAAAGLWAALAGKCMRHEHAVVCLHTVTRYRCLLTGISNELFACGLCCARFGRQTRARYGMKTHGPNYTIGNETSVA